MKIQSFKYEWELCKICCRFNDVASQPLELLQYMNNLEQNIIKTPLKCNLYLNGKYRMWLLLLFLVGNLEYN